VDECVASLEYLAERGFKLDREDEAKRLYRLIRNGLSVAVWCPEKDYLEWFEFDEAVRELWLNDVDFLIIVSYRPFVILDELAMLFDRAKRWYGVEHPRAKLYAVSVLDLDKGLEDAVNAVIAESCKAGTTESEDVCPRCLSAKLTTCVRERIFSRRWGGLANYTVLVCPNCGFKVKRLEIEQY